MYHHRTYWLRNSNKKLFFQKNKLLSEFLFFCLHRCRIRNCCQEEPFAFQPNIFRLVRFLHHQRKRGKSEGHLRFRSRLWKQVHMILKWSISLILACTPKIRIQLFRNPIKELIESQSNTCWRSNYLRVEVRSGQVMFNFLMIIETGHSR